MILIPTHGERHPRAKLTAEIVREIRREYAAKPGSVSVAAFCDEWAWRTKVSTAAIRDVVYGLKWRSV